MCSSLRLATTPYSKKKGRARNGNQISVIPNPYTFHYILTPQNGKDTWRACAEAALGAGSFWLGGGRWVSDGGHRLQGQILQD